MNTLLIYLHGFNSSPDSSKAQSLIRYVNSELNTDSTESLVEVLVPDLLYRPIEAVSQVENLLIGSDKRIVLLGSSLGGYYGIYLAQKYPCKVVLINPLVSLQESLRDHFIGKHINPYSGESFEVVQQDVDDLMQFEVNKIVNQEDYFLLLEQGDEVLDHNLALRKFPRSRQLIIPGGSHRFDNFENVLPQIMQFAGLQNGASETGVLEN